MRRAILAFAVLFIACSAPRSPDRESAATPLQTAPPSVSQGAAEPVRWVSMTLEGSQGPVDVLAEVASTPQQRAKGLMYRESLAEGKGMLFVYERRDVHTFWMKNTLIPLDMLFMDGPPHHEHISVIGIVHEAEPRTLSHRSVSAPSIYVLEVPGGWARKMGISVGSRASWEPPSGASSATP